MRNKKKFCCVCFVFSLALKHNRTTWCCTKVFADRLGEERPLFKCPVLRANEMAPLCAFMGVCVIFFIGRTDSSVSVRPHQQKLHLSPDRTPDSVIRTLSLSSTVTLRLHIYAPLVLIPTCQSHKHPANTLTISCDDSAPPPP